VATSWLFVVSCGGGLRKVGFVCDFALRVSKEAGFCCCLECGIVIEVHLCLKSYGFVVGRVEHKTNCVFVVEQLLLMLFFFFNVRCRTMFVWNTIGS
jgi:hypothetical protein